MGKMEPTIKDVAKLANISIGTVDRVLHNRGRVSQKNIEIVSAAVKELNYKPSQIARALVSRKSNVKIGITYPLVETEFWSEIETGIDRAGSELLPFGVKLIIRRSNSYSIEEQTEMIQEMMKQGISGLLFTPAGDSLTVQKLSRIIPVGTVIDDIVCPNKAFHIGPDDYGIGRLAAKLVDLFIQSKGKVLIFSPLYMTSRMPLRAQGFQDKMKQDCPGISVADIWYINGECEQEYYSDTYAKTMKAIQEIPDLRAIYVSNGLTEWVAKAVEDAGYKGKIVVIGHEYTSGVKQFLENGIIGATIYQNPTQQFHMAIKLLYEIITGNHSPDGRNLVTNCNIIMNETVPFSRFGGLEYF